ncbi:hypothetical protein [Lacihabitans soyangensis]|uniref:Uncharacterized protein n=1 Tax=Lacihabitans soyangensis TaxID=869394 RepID=A0AAE3H1X9_9BACT|nr:hypothetical protein [Lacihabitans soyangensis]MCP9763549.1 hypothetical protein [Lacihabitans soyangensis]
MKKLLNSFILLFLLWGFGAYSFAQSFTAEVGTLFLSDKPTEQFGNLKILTGVIKKGDKIEIYAETGRKFTATITKIKGDSDDEVKLLKAGEYGFFDLTFTEDPGTGKDYLRAGYKAYSLGYKPNIASIKADAEAKVTASVNFKSTLDGKPFRGKVTYKGASYWRKGVKNLLEKPYLQLQFRAVDEPDDRNLTIQIFYPKESVAKYTAKDMEVNFSGTADGNTTNTEMYGFVNGKGNTDFSLEITKWQKISSKKAIISGKISGELKEVKLLGTPKLKHRFSDGIFENVEVEVFNEVYDLKVK